MGVGCAKIGIPGIEVGIKMYQRNGTLVVIDSPQEWQGNGVITAKTDYGPDPTQKVGGGGLDL
jgi:hypothetical protein